jgi:hypothetical protein
MCDSSNDNIPFWKSIEFYTLIIAFLAFGASGFAIYRTEQYRSSDPKITVHEPTGYSISRGLFSFPSDHLIIPVEFENSGGKNAIIRYPSLKLLNKNNSKKHVFYLAGEFDEISTKSFQDKFGYEIKNSFIILPHSISLKNLVFHIKDWWDENGKNYDFKFKSPDCYTVKITYQVNQEPFVEKRLTEIPIFGSADRLDPQKDYWWDFWPLYEVSCK